MGRAKRTLVVVAFALVSCSSQMVPAATPTTKTASVLRLYATTAAMPVVNDLTTAYNQLYPSVAFDVKSGNYEAVAAEASTDPNVYFISNYLPADNPLWAAPLGQDGIAVIVHRDSPIMGITSEQLRDVYQGRVSNWDQIGGEPHEIIVVSREDGSGTRNEFELLMMGNRNTTRSAQIAPSSAAMVTSIGRTPGSIGYVSISYLNPSVRALMLDGISPTRDNVGNNRYPLRSTLFVIGQNEPEGDFRAFIGWIQSPTGQGVVAQTHAPMLAP